MPVAPTIPNPLRPDELARLVTALVDSDLADDGPHIVRARLVGDDVELAVRSTRGDHPAAHLCGLVAGADWLAVGVCARGRARSVDDGPASTGHPVRTAHLVGADGGWASRWRCDEAPGLLTTAGPGGSGAGGHGDRDRDVDEQAGDAAGAGAACGPPGDPSLPSGRVDDLCRRVFGLPTRPPATGTRELWSVLWLDAVLTLAAASAGQGVRLGPDQVARLHPAAGRGAGRRHGSGSWIALADRAADHAADHPWSLVRRAVAEAALTLDGVDPATAAWHDDGSFSRCVFDTWPPLAELRDAVAALLPAPTVQAIDHVLAAA